MRLFSFILLLLILSSCNSETKTKKEPTPAIPERGALSKDSQIFLGNRLFSEKTCITCHDINTKRIGPSIKSIVSIYKKNDSDIVAFLKGKTNPIVDTSASQVAIMQNNIDGFLKNISDEELHTIATYMVHVDELNPE